MGSSVLRWGKYGNKVSARGGGGGAVCHSTPVSMQTGRGWREVLHDPFLASSPDSKVYNIST